MRLLQTTDGSLSTPLRRFALVLAGAFLGFAAPRAVGDVFYLTSGGRIEGELLERAAGQYRIRTTLGTLALAADAVVRIEAAPSPFQEYQRRKAGAADTAEAQLSLARWCAEQNLARERQAHLQRALELAPNDEAVRRELGYVRVGEVWVNGRAAAHRERNGEAAGNDQAAEDPQRVAAAIQGNWRRRISALRATLLESVTPELVERGRQRIAEINDPLAIIPLVQVLSEGSVLSREVLLEALARFPEDAATANLAAVALVDPARRIRRGALDELVRRQDSRVSAQFRKALESGDEVLICRAAEGLGALRAKEAVPDLISMLKTRARKLVEVPVPRYLGGLGDAFTGTVMQVGSMAVPVGTAVVVANPAALVELQRRLMNVTVYHSEVLDALRQITGQDFGFDTVRWARWYEENSS